MNDQDRARMLGLVRAAIGASCLLFPRRITRLWTGEAATATTAMALRGIGGRDLALGLGLLRALEEEGHVARWLEAGAVADASDSVAALAATGIPRGRRLLTVVTAGGAAGLGLYLAANLED